MNAKELTQLLISASIDLCGHEDRKNVISMSNLTLPVGEIVSRYYNGWPADRDKRLLFYQGTNADISFRHRLEHGIKGMSYSPEYDLDVLITAFNGRLTGHPDAVVDNVVIEYKSVPNNAQLERIREQRRVPFRTFSQVQAYLLWGKYDHAIVVYESRENGQIAALDIAPHATFQRDLIRKVQKVLDIIESRASVKSTVAA